MKKRLVGVCLVLFLASLCAFPGGTSEDTSAAEVDFNETGMPIVNEPVTLHVVAKKRSDVPDFETMTFFQNIEKETGINIEWELVSEDGWQERKSLMFTSPDSMPDIFYGNGVLTNSEIVRYGDQGLLIPLNDLWDKYGENLTVLQKNYVPNLRSIATSPDGNIYALPSVHGAQSDTGCALFVNREWLEKVGLDVPKTTDDFEAMLIAFKEYGDLNGNGKNDELPFTFKFKGVDNVNGIGAMFGSFGRIDNTAHMVVEDGKVIFTAVEDEYKEAVKWFHKLYSEGLIDPESFTQDSAIIHAKIKNQDTVTVGSAPFWDLTWAVGDANSDKWIVLEPLVGPDGDQLWDQTDTSVSDLGAFAITSNCEYPEIAFRLGDYFYNSDVARDSFFGPVGVTIDRDENGEYSVIEQPEGMTEQEFRLPHAPIFNGIYAIPREQFESEYMNLAASVAEKNISLNKNVYSKYQTANYYPKLYFSLEEAEEIDSLKTDIISYVDEMTAKWMVNGGIDQEWDAYIARLKAMGLDRYLELHQNAYDRL